MSLFHVTWSADGRLPLFPDEAVRRRAVQKLAAAGREELALFCIVDEHVHAVLRGELSAVRRRVRAITRSLRGLAATSMDGGRIRIIEDRRHAANVFAYVLRQPQHHGLQVHPALWSGSCLADLVGARLVSGLRLCHREVWPRFEPADALEAVGLPRQLVASNDLSLVSRAGGHRLAEAAAAAHGLSLPLDSRRPHCVVAKRAACSLAREAGLGLGSVAAAAGFSRRSAQRLATQPTALKHRAAILTHLALGDLVLRQS
jgi:hypothetical protein